MSHLVNDLLRLNFRGNDHRELDYRIPEFIFFRVAALAVIPLISPNLFLIEDIVVTRKFNVSTQFCHIRRDISFGADVLLLGIRIQVVDSELWIDHLRIANRGHQGLSEFMKGFFTLVCNSQLDNSTRVQVIEGIQKPDGFGR